MKIAYFGNGAMGRAVQDLARAQGHVTGVVLDLPEASLDPASMSQRLAGHDVAIDFSVAQAVPTHVAAAVRAHVPIVVGTTGWQETEAAVRAQVEQGAGALLYGANFSIGVNLFYRLVQRAADLFAGQGYDAFIEEAHHKRKRDAPSGTARQLAKILEQRMGRSVPVASTRAGEIPGIHRVGFDSRGDQITMTHEARSRDGFAAGALLGAQWLLGRKGVFMFSDVLDQLLKAARS